MRLVSIRLLTAARRLAPAMLLLATVGCQMFDGDFDLSPPGRSPLHAAERSPDAVTLEIFWARFPADSVAVNEQLWREVQEDRLSPELRARLAQQGLWAGVVVGTPPAAITAMLNPAGRTVEELAAAEQTSQSVLAEAPKVTRRVKQLRFGARMELQASDVIESATLLVPSEGELSGGTFELAQAVYQLEVRKQPHCQVELQITPELRHGVQHMKYSHDDAGLLRLAPERDAEVFRELRMNVPLAPGEMLVVTGLPQSTGRLGHHFHTVETPTGREQKAVLIRLAEVPQSGAFQTANAGSAWW